MENPLLIVLLGAVIIATPVLALLAGRQTGEVIGPLIASEKGIAVAVVMGLGGGVACFFALATLIAPGVAFLGNQLRAAPIPAKNVFLWMTFFPLSAMAVVMIVMVVFFFYPVVDAAPGGLAAMAPMLAGALVAGFMAAAVVEGVISTVRGGSSGAVIVASIVLLWLAGGLITGELLLGPLDVAVDSLRGDMSCLLATALLSMFAVAALSCWACAAVKRPTERPIRSNGRSLIPVFGGPGIASALIMVKLLGRRSELRRTVSGATAAAMAGAALFGYGLQGGGDLAFALAATTVLFGCAAIPFSAYGIKLESSWIFNVAPGSRVVRDLLAISAAFIVAYVVLMIGLTLIWLVVPVSWELTEPMLGAAFVLFGSAQVVGAVLPWRGDHIIEQLVGFVSLASLALLFQWSLGEMVTRLEDAGSLNVIIKAVALAIPPAFGFLVSSVATYKRADNDW